MEDSSHIQIAQTKPKPRADMRPYHLVSKYGCRNGQKIKAGGRDLNLVKHGDNIATKHQDYDVFAPKLWVYLWKKGGDENSYSIEEVIDLIMCSNGCDSPLRFWHTQRKIFLPAIADGLELESIDEDTFIHHDTHRGACDACGTDRSAIATLDHPVEAYDIKPPIHLCATCKELLIRATDELQIDRLELHQHPKNSKNHTPITAPITNRKHNPQEKKYDEHGGLQNLDENTFVEIVSGFDKISEGTARRIYELGITGIPELSETPYSQLEEANFVGRATAKHLRNGANSYLEEHDS